ncbi:phage holin family protein [Bordetella genomosp. 1]|uniref:phage holin family protein n=1 Tax=Bordetella genomosp. 1 TaxID=1395607 RepID=UPI0015962840|nr:phage holin family protein [Bordetella genomosp. 1]
MMNRYPKGPSLRARLARLSLAARFAAGRIGQYGELLHLELALYRQSLVRSLIALVALVFAGLGAAAFLSIAVLVHYWETPWRRTTGWAIAGVWIGVAVISLLLARRNAPDGLPFQSLGTQLRLDAQALRESTGLASAVPPAAPTADEPPRSQP